MHSGEANRAATENAGPPLLEREVELDRLATLLVGARHGEGRAALIEGPAGIGKTRLLERAGENAREEGIEVLTARGGELEHDFGFGIVRQLFEALLERAPAAARAQLLSGAAGLAAAVFGAPTPRRAGADADHAVLHGLYWLTVNLSERAPLLLAVDDVQWADAPSLRFLIHLAHRLQGLPVALLPALRSGEEPSDPALIRTLVLEAEPPILRPGSLSRPAVESIVRESLGPETGAPLGAACHRASGGNPFLLAELLGELRRDGRSAAELDPAIVGTLAPARITAAMLLRLGRLDPGAALLARAISVLGGEATLAATTALAGVEPGSAAAHIAALTDAGLLAPGEPPRFAHPLIRTAIYEELPHRERGELHARAARILAAAGAPPESVAIHLLATAPAGEEWVVATLREAAAAAGARGAQEIGIRLLRRALQEPPTETAARAELHFELGRAEHDLGKPAAAEQMRRAFELADEPLLRARALAELSWVIGPQGEEHRELLPLYERGAAEVRPHDSELALKLEGARLWALTLIPDHPRRFEQETERFASLPGETPAECAVIALVARGAYFRGATVEEVGRLAERAARHPALVEEGPRSAWLLNTVICLIAAERFLAAERLLGRVIAAGTRRGSQVDFAYASAMRGIARCAAGDLHGALHDARGSIEARPLAPQFAFVALTPLIEALTDQGGAEEGAAVLAENGLDGKLGPERQYTALMIARGRLRAAAGDLIAARGDLEEALARLKQGRSGGVIGLDARLELALIDHALDERSSARERVAEALRLATAWQGRRALGGALRVAGIVREGAEGLTALERAASTLEDSEARLLRARALVDLGTAMRRGGRRSEARERLAEGMDLAHRCGAGPLVATAREELRLAGARPRRIALTGRDSLTPGELRVADLAAGGATNKDIAQALFVTLRTVEMHLSNAYRKLEISSREELPTALARTR